MKTTFLNHILDANTPGYGGKTDFGVEQVKHVCHGDTCNQQRWSLSNHIGTHVDVPHHFFEDGKTITDYQSDEWIFSNVQLLRKVLVPDEILRPDPWIQDISPDTDCLLIQSGMEKHRHSEVYWKNNPGLSPELGTWLREHRPNLKIIGFDFLSATSFQNRSLGKAAHQAFLNPKAPGNPIRILEDMKLGHLKEGPVEVLVLPLLVSKADGSPTTIIARF